MLTIFKARSRKTETGLQVESESRGFKLIMDEPRALGGTDSGMNPIEALLCALGSCQSIVVAAFAKAQNFKYEEFHVELEGDLDPDGFLGRSDVKKGLQEIRFTMHFKTEESQESCERFADFVQSTCPVENTLLSDVKILRTAVVKDEGLFHQSLRKGNAVPMDRHSVSFPCIPTDLFAAILCLFRKSRVKSR